MATGQAQKSCLQVKKRLQGVSLGHQPSMPVFQDSIGIGGFSVDAEVKSGSSLSGMVAGSNTAGVGGVDCIDMEAGNLADEEGRREYTCWGRD